MAREFNVDWDDKATEEQMISRILFAVTSQNGHSPLRDNNYWIVPDDYQLQDQWDSIYNPDEPWNPIRMKREDEDY